MKRFFLHLLLATSCARPASVFLEAEAFQNCGGWINDNQSVTQMGSPYLIAHGMGRPVADALTLFSAPKAGNYRLWVRSRDWTPPCAKKHDCTPRDVYQSHLNELKDLMKEGVPSCNNLTSDYGRFLR